MFDQAELRDAAAELLAGTARGQDAAANAQVAEAASAARATLESWQADGSRLPHCEPVLQSLDDLLDALYAANPEGLPFGVRDEAARMLALLDLAEENGFSVRPGANPAP